MITYNKEYRKKDGRLLTASGPRALQNRPTYSDNDISDMRAELDRLKLLVADSGGSTHVIAHDSADINDLINDAVTKSLLEAETLNTAKIKEYKAKIDYLTKEIVTLNSDLVIAKEEHRLQVTSYEKRLGEMFVIVTGKDVMINNITDRLLSSNTCNSNASERAKVIETCEDNAVANNERPGMDNVYIDPNKGAEDSMKSHVKIKEVKSDIDVNSSVDKLRGLLGKLPKK